MQLLQNIILVIYGKAIESTNFACMYVSHDANEKERQRKRTERYLVKNSFDINFGWNIAFFLLQPRIDNIGYVKFVRRLKAVGTFFFCRIYVYLCNLYSGSF